MSAVRALGLEDGIAFPQLIASESEGVLVDTGEREPSDDVAGRNADKLDRIYRLRGG